jgi:hypothetical protein
MNIIEVTTIKALISILQGMPQDLPVLVSGYESGYETFYPPKTVEVINCPDNPFYDGEYQIPELNDASVKIQAVILERLRRDV